MKRNHQVKRKVMMRKRAIILSIKNTKLYFDKFIFEELFEILKS
jgi:hypothetical protein